MKTFRLVKRIFLAAAVLPMIFMSSCVKDDFDTPPINVPVFTLPEGATLKSIVDLKAMHTTGSLDSVTENIYITGIVIGNDEFGNIYKTIIIQDETSGIEIKLNKTSLYNDYKLGQRVYVKCQGLILGDYHGLTQLGTIYGNSVGQIAEVNIPNHLFKDSLPGLPLTPRVITNASEISTDMVSTLCRFEGASFAEVGSMFVEPGETNTNRTLNIPGGTLTMRSSSYAAFATEKIPSGEGTVIAILGYYDAAYQATLRNSDDLIGFVPDPNTYFVDELFTTNPGWLTYSVASNKDWTWDATFKCMIANNYGGDVAGEDWLFAPQVNLSGMDSAFLEFRTWSAYQDPGQAEPISIMVSTNYSSGTDPNAAPTTWTQVYGNLCPYSQTWTDSGPIDLTQFAGQTISIAWRYRSSGTTAVTASKWEIDGVKIRGKVNP